MFTEFELVPSSCMRAYFEELHFKFTDFQKATLIWNAPGKTWKARLETLNELAEITEDNNVRQQIHERIDFEQKKWGIFLNNDSGRYIYVVEDWDKVVAFLLHITWHSSMKRSIINSNRIRLGGKLYKNESNYNKRKH